MGTNTKFHFTSLLPKISLNEWKAIKAVTRAWSLRDVAKISSLPVSTVHTILTNFRRKGRLQFLFNQKRVNLLVLAAVFPKLQVESVPPFTRAIRVVYNMGPCMLVSALIPPPFVKKYLDCFKSEPLVVVRGYELIKWTPLSPLTRYDPETRSLVPVFDFENIVDSYRYTVKRWNSYRAPDIYDLVLLQGRIRNPFARPLAIYKEAKKLFDPSLPDISEQVLSYHFNKHVKAMWKGNTALVYADTGILPIKIYYFEGKDAPLFARILCQLPGAFSAVIDVNKAVLAAQYPCIYEAYIMQEAEYFKVEMPYPPFIQSSASIVKVFPLLWKYVENKKWVFKEELAIPVRNTAKLKLNNSA